MIKTENWQAIFIVLTDTSLTESVLKILVDCEIRGATIIETQGMGQVLGTNIPVIGSSVRALLAQQHENSKTIFAVSKHPEKIDKVMKLIAEKMHGFSEPNSGMMFVVPVLKAVGIGKKEFAQDE